MSGYDVWGLYDIHRSQIRHRSQSRSRCPGFYFLARDGILLGLGKASTSDLSHLQSNKHITVFSYKIICISFLKHLDITTR
jgi:hypothetical protein